jgi:hypothetical protein
VCGCFQSDLPKIKTGETRTRSSPENKWASLTEATESVVVDSGSVNTNIERGYRRPHCRGDAETQSVGVRINAFDWIKS